MNGLWVVKTVKQMPVPYGFGGKLPSVWLAIARIKKTRTNENHLENHFFLDAFYQEYGTGSSKFIIMTVNPTSRYM